MKKRLKAAEDITIGDCIKITGYIWEVDSITTSSVDGSISLDLWLWASPRKRMSLTFYDRKFPVTVR